MNLLDFSIGSERYWRQRHELISDQFQLWSHSRPLSKLSDLFANYHRQRIMGYSVFTYTFHVPG